MNTLAQSLSWPEAAVFMVVALTIGWVVHSITGTVPRTDFKYNYQENSTNKEISDKEQNNE